MGVYNVPLDMESKNSASIIIGRIKPNSTVLEFGAANGRMTKYLTEEKNCIVDILELDANAYEDAIKYARKGYQGDVEQYEWINIFEASSYDHIIFADVLEHLENPSKLLLQVKPLLKEAGTLLVSVPNIAHSAVILSLLENKFEYRKEGLLDKTHIHFFTYNTLINMLSEAAYFPIYETTINILPWYTELAKDIKNSPSSIQYQLASKSYGTAYQFIMECCKANTESSIKTTTVKNIYKAYPVDQLQIHICKNSTYSENFAIKKAISVGNVIVDQNLEEFGEVYDIRLHIANIPIVLHTLNLQINNKEVDVNTINGNFFHYNNLYIFTKPSEVYISSQENISNIFVSFHYSYIHDIDLLSNIQQILTDMKSLNLQNEDLGSKQIANDLEVENLRKNLQENNNQYLNYLSIFETNSQEIQENRGYIEHLEQEANIFSDLYHDVINSTSWRISAPIRGIGKITKFISKAVCLLKEKGVKQFLKIILLKVKSLFSNNKSSLTTSQSPLNTDIELLDRWVNNYVVPFKLQIIPDASIVDVVIPIYNGFEFLDKLFETISRTKIRHRIIVIEDSSPDERVLPYLENLYLNKQIDILIQNPVNLGFVKSVNKAFKVAKNHIALLNTDIELPNEWLERLMYPIFKNNKVASTTPFTNSGTICSFPNFLQDNQLYLNLSLDEIDSQFKQINPTFTEIPTGVGFCMGINHAVLTKIGIFDDITFTEGYGEENDWCQRAIKAGYKNVMIENMFVYHKHGASFSTQQKSRLMKKNAELLSKKHPNYNHDVAKYIERNPIKVIRDYLIMKINNQYVSESPILVFHHNLGGGADIYINQRIKEWLDQKKQIYMIQYDIRTNLYILSYFYKDIMQKHYLSDYRALQDLQINFNFQEIILNEIVTYPNLNTLLPYIVTLSQKAKIHFLAHDYFPICPTVNLVDYAGQYCGIPNYETCEICLNKITQTCYESCKDINEWRGLWEWFFNNIDEITYFSYSTREIYSNVFNLDLKENITPHAVQGIPKITTKYKRSTTINIGLLGVLSHNKGQEKIIQLINIAEQNNIDLKFILMGTATTDIFSDKFISTGKYINTQLPHLILKYDIDIIFIASICPETFSFTTQEAIEMNIPVVSYPIGAPPERLNLYDKGKVLSSFEPHETMKEILLFGEENLQMKRKNKLKKKILFLHDQTTFSFRYRVEHHQEQLWHMGIESEIINIKNIADINITEYSNVIIYRCEYSPQLKTLIVSAQNYNICVYYDIDDYIFNYDDIQYLDFIKEDAYSAFEAHSKSIYACMEICSAYITSTNMLAEKIRKTFPGKLVKVNRNVASLEMQYISNTTKKRASDKKIVLGYFSGSHSHDRDFAIISNILAQLLKKYDNLYLQITGNLKLPVELEPYQQQIITLPFVPWRDLPQIIANVDINLMPLEDTDFHFCKSENKWMEAALVKVPTVASYNMELTQIMNNGVNAYLCKSKNEWENALEFLITNESKRSEIANNAYQIVKEKQISTSLNYSPSYLRF